MDWIILIILLCVLGYTDEKFKRIEQMLQEIKQTQRMIEIR